MEKGKIIKPNTNIIAPPLSPAEFRTQFDIKVNDLKDWGKRNGYEIDAYLHISIKGINTDIGFMKL